MHGAEVQKIPVSTSTALHVVMLYVFPDSLIMVMMRGWGLKDE
jgi:hypothetical protein